MKRLVSLVLLLYCCLTLLSCSTNNSTANDKGQPNFPSLGEYWVIDPYGLVNQDVIEASDQVFEQLRQDNIAEIAIVIQKGIKDKGPMNDELIWARNWGRSVKLGDKEDQRAIVWLIRPDVKPEENRITIEISTKLTWLTVGDYGPIMEDAAEYANYDDFNGAVESLTRNTDEVLRRLWKERNN